MKLVKDNLFEFTRGNDPLNTLGIGYKAKIQKFFDDLGVNRDDYNIEDKQIIFKNTLDLIDCTSLVELPDNLFIIGDLDLIDCINLVKLPDNLTVGSCLNLDGCISLKEIPDNLDVAGYLSIEGCYKILKLPDNLQVISHIYVKENQFELVKWIKSSKFKDKLEVI